MPLGEGFQLVFIGPASGAFELFLPGGGNSPIKKIARGNSQAWNWLIHKDFYLLTLLPSGGVLSGPYRLIITCHSETS